MNKRLTALLLAIISMIPRVCNYLFREEKMRFLPELILGVVIVGAAVLVVSLFSIPLAWGVGILGVSTVVVILIGRHT